MPPDKIVFIDTETGGIDPFSNSLLSIGLAIWSECRIIDSFEILINDGELSTTSKALEVNGIDINNHKMVALSPKTAVLELYAFLNSHFQDDELITLAGHNVNFDINFLKVFLSKNGYDFQKRFSHRIIDTSSILYYLYLSGKMAKKAISSQKAFDLFGIRYENRHTALGDAKATAQLFSKLLNEF